MQPPIPKINLTSLNQTKPQEEKDQAKLKPKIDQPLTKIDTALLKPVRHPIPPDSYIQLSDKGWIVLYLAKQAKKVTISGDGTRVIVEGKSKKAEYRAFTEGATLPSKLKPWYQYAHDFI